MTTSAATTTTTTTMETSTPSQTAQKKNPLPKLSAAEFKAYNRQADIMEYYHTNFRRTWKTMYSAAETNSRPSNMALSKFINMGLQFVHHITVHHDIEETYMYPVLGSRMPEFRQAQHQHQHQHQTSQQTPSEEIEDDDESSARARKMVEQHAQIHAGLDRLQEYLEKCKSGQIEFRLQGEQSLKAVMDSFGEILWVHLDEEVKLLGAENMRKYWSLDEVRGMNW